MARTRDARIHQPDLRHVRSSRPTWPPVRLKPMLARPATKLPDDAGRPGERRAGSADWGYEFKWDGIRLLAVWDGSTLRLISRNGLDMTEPFPELSGAGGLGVALGARRRVVLDGELIAPDEQGRPSFQFLQRRLNVRAPVRGGLSAAPGQAGAAAARARASRRRVRVVYMLFDLLCEGDEPLLARPYTERRDRLERLALDADRWRTPWWQAGRGEAMLRAATEAGLEGVIAKRLESVYRPGVRSPAWLKVKVGHQQEFVVVGWTEMRGRPGRLGSLLVGYREFEAPRRWRLAGQVGSGLDERERAELRVALKPFGRTENVVVDPLPVRREAVHHVEPLLVVQVNFQQWTADGSLRHPVYRGVRLDKDAREVVRET